MSLPPPIDMSAASRSDRMRSLMTRAVSFDNVTAFTATPLNAPASPSGSRILSHAFPDASPTTASLSPRAAAAGGFAKKRLAIVMVGLPARGKSHIARCLARYLNWLGFNAAVWNVGNYRRALLGAGQDAAFFEPGNADGAKARMEFAMECLNDMLNWFDEDEGVVGIYDATNSTVARRAMVRERLEAAGVRVLFLESICSDEDIVQRNITENKVLSPDYRNADPEAAVKDFAARIATYAAQAETVADEENCSYIKIVNVGKQIILNDIKGFVQGKIVSFLLNTQITRRNIYLSRHGESEWNVSGQLGGDPNLTPRGRSYARLLSEFIEAEFENGSVAGSEGSNASTGNNIGGDDAKHRYPAVWTSQLQRTRQTVEHIPTVNVCWRALNEIDAGVCEGMTYAEVADKLPDVASARKEDKLRYRYPGGESYVDVIYRLEPVILELERQKGPVLIVAHNAVIRAIYAYFSGKRQEDCPNLDIPLHTVFKLTTNAYGALETRFPLDVSSTYKNKTPESSRSTPSEPDAGSQQRPATGIAALSEKLAHAAV